MSSDCHSGPRILYFAAATQSTVDARTVDLVVATVPTLIEFNTCLNTENDFL